MKEGLIQAENKGEDFCNKAIDSLKEDTFLVEAGIEMVSLDYYKNNEYKAYLHMKFLKGTSVEAHEIYSRIEEILSEQGLTFSIIGPNFPNLVSYVVYPEFVNQKINWRRFLPRPENFSEENIKILDEIATFLELNDFLREVKGDSLHKFSRLVSKAKQEGLITEEEFKNIESQYYMVAH